MAHNLSKNFAKKDQAKQRLGTTPKPPDRLKEANPTLWMKMTMVVFYFTKIPLKFLQTNQPARVKK